MTAETQAEITELRADIMMRIVTSDAEEEKAPLIRILRGLRSVQADAIEAARELRQRPRPLS